MRRVVHFEIYTDDPEAVQPFYGQVFGFTPHGEIEPVTIANRVMDDGS